MESGDITKSADNNERLRLSSANLKHLKRISALLTNLGHDSKPIGQIACYIAKTTQEEIQLNNKWEDRDSAGLEQNCLKCGNAFQTGLFTLRTKRRPRVTKKLKRLFNRDINSLSRKERDLMSYHKKATNKFILTCLLCKNRTRASGNKRNVFKTTNTAPSRSNNLQSILREARILPKKKNRKNVKVIRKGSKSKLYRVSDLDKREEAFGAKKRSKEGRFTANIFRSPNLSFQDQQDPSPSNNNNKTMEIQPSFSSLSQTGVNKSKKSKIKTNKLLKQVLANEERKKSTPKGLAAFLTSL